ncbi:S-adenosyl-L-methionine-dependent methyltransferase [Cladochytrium replicatum]|nr:S-adenosyl-L-methionine-dependent methyltransferase [Cladochytrium replicatum]
MEDRREANKEHFSKAAAAWDSRSEIQRLATHAAASISKHVFPKLAKPSKEAVCLDFGCGVGVLSNQLRKDAKHIVGVDLAEGMIDVNKSKIEPNSNVSAFCVDLSKASDASVLRGELDRLGSAPGFDLIFSHLVFHHLDDPKAMIAMLSKFLAPGGILVVTDILQTPSSHLFHAGHAHASSTVGALGGFSKAFWVDAVDGAGMRDAEVVERAFVMEKEVPVKDIERAGRQDVLTGHGHGHMHAHGHGDHAHGHGDHGHGHGGEENSGPKRVMEFPIFLAMARL